MMSSAHLPGTAMQGFQKAYNEAAQIAFETLQKGDIDQICHRTGAIKGSQATLSINYLGNVYTIDLEKRTFISDVKDIELADKLIILHY